MMNCGTWPIAVCTWSLQVDPAAILPTLADIGLRHLHLGWAFDESDAALIKEITNSDWTVTSTMIAFPQEDYSSLEAIRRTGGVRPDDCWKDSKALFQRAIDLNLALGCSCISMHAGHFVDEATSALVPKMFHRVTELANIAHDEGVTLLLETGQETAAEVRALLEYLEHPGLAVNFDPANVILYDKGDPIAMLELLAPWVKHVHIKDAVRTKAPGEWGTEVPWGDGEVGADKFLGALRRIGYQGPLAIEREQGNSRLTDIKLAVERLTTKQLQGN